MRYKFVLLIGGLLSITLMLGGCGSITTAQQGSLSDIPVPTAPPVPTSAPETIPPAPSAKPDKSNPQTLASSSFDDVAELNNWRVFDLFSIDSETSVWKVQNSRLEQALGPDGTVKISPTGIVTGDDTWTDYRVQADANARDNTLMGVVGRYSPQGFYALIVSPSNNPSAKVQLVRYDAATESFTSLAKSNDGGWNRNTWVNLSLAFNGSTITGLVNGKPVLTANDTTYGAGQAGAYGYAEGSLSFDNFVVQR